MKADLRLRIYSTSPYFGNGTAQLLEGIERYGSLKKSYTAMGMSSSKAWKILRRAQEDLGEELFVSTSGGIQGGSSALTEFGKDFLEKYRRVSQDVNAALEKSLAENFPDARAIRL